MTTVDVDVEASAWTDAVSDAEDVVDHAVQAVMAHADVAPETANVTVLLADDAALAALNAQFRGKSGPTNVLSFPSPPNPEGHLGDLALAYETCAREATEQGKPLAAHLAHLVAHGVLHLLGFDHEDDAEAEVMEAAEREALAQLGLPDPYAGEDRTHA